MAVLAVAVVTAGGRAAWGEGIKQAEKEVDEESSCHRYLSAWQPERSLKMVFSGKFLTIRLVRLSMQCCGRI